MARRARRSGASVTDGEAGAESAAALPSVSTVFDSLETLVYAFDLETNELLYLNEFGKRIFGRDVIGHPCYEVLQANQHSPCSFCTNDKLVCDGVPQGPAFWEFQNTLTGRWYQCIDQAVPWSNGRLVRLELAINIDDRKRNEQFRERYVDLISHDLRAPLTVLKLMGESLQLKAERFPAIEKEAKLVGASTARMVDMVDDLKDSIKFGTGKLILSKVSRSCLDFVEDVLAKTVPEEELHRIVLSDFSTGAVILIDAPKLERAIVNLVSNAIKYSADGTPIRIGLFSSESDVEVSIQNHGHGIAAESIPKVFDWGYRTMEAQEKRGLGLGLYITRQIIEAHGGQIWVESTPGKTTTFTFNLPLESVH